MKTYSTLTVCGVVVVAASGLWGLRSSLGQSAAVADATETPSPKPAKERVLNRGEGRYEGGYGGGGEGGYGMGFGEEGAVKGRFRRGPDPLQEIREAAAALGAAEDDDARADAERKLNELLNEYFEEDMKRREQELADVEARVKKLRELLERRREKKRDIIELQVEVLRNEADGLGFFSGDGPRGLMNGHFQFHADPLTVPWQAPAGAVLPAGHPAVPGAAAPPRTAPTPPAPREPPR